MSFSEVSPLTGPQNPFATARVQGMQELTAGAQWAQHLHTPHTFTLPHTSSAPQSKEWFGSAL